VYPAPLGIEGYHNPVSGTVLHGLKKPQLHDARVTLHQFRRVSQITNRCSLPAGLLESSQALLARDDNVGKRTPEVAGKHQVAHLYVMDLKAELSDGCPNADAGSKDCSELFLSVPGVLNSRLVRRTQTS
jgi:hypothetical protein